MCGIAGFSLSEMDSATVNSRKLTKNLLLGIESRGKDATGFAFLDKDATVQLHKQNVPASRFVRNRLTLPKRTRTLVAHTRAATQGSPTFNENNHPLLSGSVVGVHNGVVWNDDYLWRTLVDPSRRQAEVDSEVIFAAIAHAQQDSLAGLKDVLESISGSAAIAWLDRDTPDALYLARISSSPLIVAQTAGGSVVFASTKYALEKAMNAVGLVPTLIRDINEGIMLSVIGGSIEDVSTFDPVPKYTRYYTSGGVYVTGGSSDKAKQEQHALGSGDETPPRGDSLDELLAKMDNGEYDEFYESVLAAQGDFNAPFKSAAESAAAFVAAESGILVPGGTTTDNRKVVDVPGVDDAVPVEAIIVGEDEDDLDEAAFWSPFWMSKDYFNTAKDVPFMDEEAYQEAYAEREALINAWFEGFTGPYDAMCNAARNLCAFIRPGDPVTTFLGGEQGVPAEVVELPVSFPNGNYLLRCFTGVREWDAGAAMDVVLVMRHFSQFTVLNTSRRRTTASIVTDGHSPVAG